MWPSARYEEARSPMLTTTSNLETVNCRLPRITYILENMKDKIGFQLGRNIHTGTQCFGTKTH